MKVITSSTKNNNLCSICKYDFRRCTNRKVDKLHELGLWKLQQRFEENNMNVEDVLKMIQ